MKRIARVVIVGLLLGGLLFAEDLKLDTLSDAQLGAMISATVNVNLHVFKDDTWGDRVSEAEADPENQVKIGLIEPYMGSKVTVTRKGSVNKDGLLPVECSFMYPELVAPGKVKKVLIEKQVVKIGTKTDDFGDSLWTIDASNVLKNDANRKVRDSLELTQVRLYNLVTYLAQQSAPKGYDRIVVGTVFKGTYNKGQSDMTVTVTDVQKDGDNLQIAATVDFLGSHKVAGSYTVKGVLDAGTNKLRLEKDKPISIPKGYGMVGFTGTIDPVTLAWSGFLLEYITVDFTVTKQ
jgi:hypothetical protein